MILENMLILSEYPNDKKTIYTIYEHRCLVSITVNVWGYVQHGTRIIGSFQQSYPGEELTPALICPRKA